MTILVVVLDEDVRGLISEILSQSSRNVVSAGDKAYALDVAHSTEIDLLLVELAPWADGRSLAERLRARMPALPVLYVTGWFDHPSFMPQDGEMVLKEPFSRDQLLRAIDDVLKGDRTT